MTILLLRAVWVLPLLLACQASGAQQAAAAPASRPAGKAAAPAALGAQLATQGVAPVPACSGCHGARGEGQPAAGFPRLGGQPQPYLRRQLEAYAQGQRRNPVMEPIAKQMTPAQRDAASTYYARLAAPAAVAASAPTTSALLRGRQLAVHGDESRQVQACANCHGPGGIGSAPTYPALAGQSATYLVQSLGEWKQGTRKTDPSGQMPQIAQRLQQQDIEAVAAYFAQQRPGPAPDSVPARTPAYRAGPVVVSGPRPAQAGNAPATAGQGTEQGSPVQGGSQFGSDPNSGNGRQPQTAPGAAPSASEPRQERRP